MANLKAFLTQNSKCWRHKQQ